MSYEKRKMNVKTGEPIKLDLHDKHILDFIQTRSPFTANIHEIGKKLNIHPATVNYKLKRLQKEGVIKSIAAQIEGQKVDKGLILFCLVRLRYPEKKEEAETVHTLIPKELAKIRQVQEVHTITGEWDVVLKLKVKNHAEYNKILKEKILPLGHIVRITSLAVLDTLKETSFIYVD